MPAHKTWTKEEEKILNKLYYNTSKREILIALPKKNWQQIIRRAFKLKLKRIRNLDRVSTWSKEELAYLYKNYSYGKKEDLLKYLNKRTWIQIRNKASDLNIKRINRVPLQDRWSQEELNYLKQNYNLDPNILIKNLNNRSWKSIRSKINQLKLERDNQWGVRSWTAKEIEYLKKNFYNGSIGDLIENLKKEWGAITNKAYKLKLNRKKDQWTTEELDYLKQNYSLESKQNIKNNLKEHSWRAIGLMASKMNIKRDSKVIKKERELSLSKKYGVTNVSQRPEVIGKIYKTKNKNKTLNSSIHEEFITVMIETIFDDVVTHYKSKEYPYSCDYYIPSCKMYLEYQGFWTHGLEPYDGYNVPEKWKIKAETSIFYKNAIDSYIRDSKKRLIAHENNLNYLEIWGYDYEKSFQWVEQLIRKQGLPLSYTEEALLKEFNSILQSKGDYSNSPRFNKIIEHFQFHFYKKERELWNHPVIREKLVLNREKYLAKPFKDITIKELLRGFKISGINRNAFSFFSPLWIKSFIEKYNIKSIYDPCSGWGHRLLGSAEITYIGNDNDSKTYKGLCAIKDYFNLKDKYLYNNLAEEFTPDEEYEAVFTCPPYFKTELYDNDNTSTNKYEKYKEWLNIWWRAVIKKSLKPHVKYFAFVINKKYKDDMLKVCLEEGLILVEITILGKKQSNHFQRAVNKTSSNEFLIVFEKS